MTSTEQQQTATARTNSEGDPCPSWCDTDHAKYTFHGSARVAFVGSDFYRYSARAVRHASGDKIAVGGAGRFYVEHADAAELADFIDGLADAKPQDLHALAAAIRKAAAVVK